MMTNTYHNPVVEFGTKQILTIKTDDEIPKEYYGQMTV